MVPRVSQLGIHGQTETKTFCSMNASKACQKYLCGRWKVNFSFSFSMAGGLAGCEKARQGTLCITH